MMDHSKLPLLKRAFALLVKQLRAQDQVSIVTYAGSAGIVLPPTSGSQKARILDSVSRLEAGGSTAGGEGIRLAYKVARNNFFKAGNNRVVLATDGDFNVGVSSEHALVDLIEKKRKAGVHLTVLGFGMGHLERLEDGTTRRHGDGNYAYIDTLLEARRC